MASIHYEIIVNVPPRNVGWSAWVSTTKLQDDVIEHLRSRAIMAVHAGSKRGSFMQRREQKSVLMGRATPRELVDDICEESQ